MEDRNFLPNKFEKKQIENLTPLVMPGKNVNKNRHQAFIFCSLVCFCLFVLEGCFQLWNMPLGIASVIKPSRTTSVIKPSGTASTIKPVATKPAFQDWKLIFNDEFNDTRLDFQKWNIEDSSKDGYQNCCLNYGEQFYTPQAISLSQGSLQIETRREEMGGSLYTSGAITTENNFSFKYGRVDIRARLPKTQGYWPAFWLLPDHSEGIAPFEIDMMELLGKDPTTVHMVNHWGSKQHSDVFTGPDFSQDYHVFSLIWTSRAISWFIDGVQRFKTTKGISDQNMYLIINSSLGGRWAGKPDRTTILPQDMNIDYVRIYQPVDGASY